jgi:hypothetical protein
LGGPLVQLDPLDGRPAVVQGDQQLVRAVGRQRTQGYQAGFGLGLRHGGQFRLLGNLRRFAVRSVLGVPSATCGPIVRIFEQTWFARWRIFGRNELLMHHQVNHQDQGRKHQEQGETLFHN